MSAKPSEETISRRKDLAAVSDAPVIAHVSGGLRIDRQVYAEQRSLVAWTEFQPTE